MITIESKGYKEGQMLLSTIPGGIEKAAARAFNRGATRGKTIASRYATAEYYIKSRDVRDAIKITRASYKAPIASMIVRGRRFSMIRFKHNGKAGISRPNHPKLKVGVKKSSGMEVKEKHFFQHGKNGVLHVFYRMKDDQRNPINVARGPSIPQMLGTKKATEFIENKTVDVVNGEFDRQVHHLLEGGR